MIETRKTVVEADFLNNIIITHPSLSKINITPELREKFFSSVVDPFWHTEKDVLDYFAYYSTGEYFCQRKKLKYDFKHNVNYWSTYTFKEATKEQVDALVQNITDFISVLTEVKNIRIEQEIKKINDDLLFSDQRYMKKIVEKNEMLASSDWRVLPDVVDSYPGEKDMWITWRSKLRDETIKKPNEFESALEFLKYIYNIKFPIDPKRYWEKYPEGDVEYLSTEDQWVKYDAVASTDFVNSRMMNLVNLAGKFAESHKKISESSLNMMKLMGIDELVPVNWDIYYTDDTELEQKE